MAGDPQAIKKRMGLPAAKPDPRHPIFVEKFVDYFRKLGC
jgi:hypothetical protein